MFWSKSRKIRKLEEELEQERVNSRRMYKIQGDELQGLRDKLKEAKEALVGLTADRDRARDSLDELQKQIPQLKIERDLSARRVEELEEANRERQGNIVELLPVEDDLTNTHNYTPKDSL